MRPRHTDGERQGVDDHGQRQSKTYGDTLSLGTTAFTTAGLTNSDAVTGVTLASDGAVATAAKGSHAITPSLAVGSGLNNYAITYDTGTLTVNAATLDRDGELPDEGLWHEQPPVDGYA